MGQKRKWPPTIYPHKSSGRDRIRVGGHDYWLGPTGSEESRQEYARLVQELVATGAATPKPKGYPLLAELVRTWERDRAPTMSEKEASHTRRALAILVRGRAKLRTDAVTLAVLSEVRTQMLRTPPRHRFSKDSRQDEGWSRNHANRQITRIRTVWRWAEEQSLVPPGSWAHLRALRPIPEHDRSVRHTAKVRAATQEDLDAVLKRLRSPEVRAMLQVQWLTGMRSGEVRTMRSSEVDTTDAVWIYKPAWHKNSWRGQSRIVAIGPQAQEILRPFLERRGGDRLLFLTRKGTPYTAASYGLAGRRAAKKTGRTWWRNYCLRHGAKQRFTKEFGLDVARSLLGQKSIGTTNNYGDQVDTRSAIDAAQKLG